MSDQPRHHFLSDDWVAAARAVREEYRGRVDDAPAPIRMNHVITQVPFGEGTIHTHLDTTSGIAELDLGHLPDPDLTVTLDYDTAKAVLVDGNPQVAIQAFMAGRITVQGDMTKLMAFQGTQLRPVQQELAERIRAITE